MFEASGRPDITSGLAMLAVVVEEEEGGDVARKMFVVVKTMRLYKQLLPSE